MRGFFARTWVVAIALSLAADSGFAQRRPATDSEAVVYIHSAFMTQADPGVLKASVILGPELQKAYSLPAGAEGAKVYQNLIDAVGDKPFDVRTATGEEIDLYRGRRGFDPSAGQPFVLVIGPLRLLLQYDLQALNVGFVGQLDLPDPDPRPVLATQKPAAKPQPVSLLWTAEFEYNKLELTAESRARLEAEVLPQLKQASGVRFLNISGHADRLGSSEYNQRLSEQRAEALRAYFVERGVAADKIEVFGYGKTLPVKSCREEKGAALKECLAPNRRVVIELQANITQ